MVLQVLIVAVLLFIFYQDMRYRAVYWIVFPLLLLLMIVVVVKNQTIQDLFISSSYNIGFLLAQLVLLFVYFSVKERRLVNITSGYLGWGDILFLLCIAFYLSPFNYLIFYIASLLVVLCFSLIIYYLKPAKESKIPLAGLQAIMFSLLFLADWRIDNFNMTNDHWLLNYLAL